MIRECGLCGLVLCNLMRLALWPSMRPVSIRSTFLILLPFDSLTRFFICLLYQLLGEFSKLTTTKVDLSSSSFSSVTFYFIYFEAMLLEVVSYFLHFFVRSIDQMFQYRRSHCNLACRLVRVTW